MQIGRKPKLEDAFLTPIFWPGELRTDVQLVADWSGGGLAVLDRSQFFLTLSSAALAAGDQDLTIGVVPTTEIWRLLAASIQLTAGAVVTQRARLLVAAPTGDCAFTDDQTISGQMIAFGNLRQITIPPGTTLRTRLLNVALNDTVQIVCLVIRAPLGVSFYH